MNLSKEQVLKIARLARLNLTEDEISRFSNELTEILSYVGMISTLDTSKVQPTNQVTGLTDVLREDSLDADFGQLCSADELIACSPLPKDGKQIRVKKIL